MNLGGLLTGRAEAQELQQMAFQFKPGLPGQPVFQFTELTVSEVNNLAAVGAKQVVMMFGRSSRQIAPAVTSGVHLTDEPQLVKYLKRAVNGYQADIGVILMQPIIDVSRGKVIRTGGNYLYYGSSLRGKLIAVLP